MSEEKRNNPENESEDDMKKVNPSDSDMKSETTEEDGVEVIFEPEEEGDPKDLKGTKLADCTFQSFCTGLA